MNLSRITMATINFIKTYKERKGNHSNLQSIKSEKRKNIKEYAKKEKEN